jgi:hypothetical protein
MDEITEQCLKIIESHENGILQCDLWKLANIDSRKCTRIVVFLLSEGRIERTEVKVDNIRTFLLKKILSLEEILATIESKHNENEGPSVKEFIESHRLVVNNEIVRALPIPPIQSFKILDGPLSEILVNDLLEKGKTISQLSKKIEVSPDDIKKELTGLITRQTLLEDGFIIRRSDWTTIIEPKKSEFVYSVIPIPMEAKIFDLLLGFSLLNWGHYFQSFEKNMEIIPAEEVIESFRELCCDFWEISEETFNEIYQIFNPQFVNSIFGPLPVIRSPSMYESIRDTICNSDTLALQLPLKDDRINDKIAEIEISIQCGFGTLAEVEYCVIALMDVMKVCEKNKWKSDVKHIQQLNEELFRKIFDIPNFDIEQLFEDEKVGESDTEIPWKMEGEGNHRITFTAPSETLVISGEYQGAYLKRPEFSVDLHSPSTVKCIAKSLKEISFFEQMPAIVGEAYTLDIKAVGYWVIEVNCPIPDSAETLPFHIVGENDSSSDFFVLTEGKKEVSIQSFNSEHIVVTMKNSHGNFYAHLLTEIGPVDKKITIKNDLFRICKFDVKTSGKWIIGIENI